MKSIFFTSQFHLIIVALIIFSLITSCNDYSMKKNESSTNTSTPPTPDRDGDGVVDTTLVLEDSAATAPTSDSIIQHHFDRPLKNSEVQKPAKGTAMVYCPTKMIRSVPSIVNAAISKDELSTALKKFQGIIQDENPKLKSEDIARDTRNDSIDLYEKMLVKIEFDHEDFVQIGEDDVPVKEFGNKNMLEWEWVLKPKQITRKSIINFKFYYVDPDKRERFIMEKIISIAVIVDARSYIEKLGDLFFVDFKSGMTTILIPLFTFFGGLISGRRKKN